MTTHQVFVHGELARKHTLLQVIGRDSLAIKAVLHGYERVLDPAVDLYVAVKKDGGAIEGKLLTGITDREMLAIDEFEGVSENLYERALVEVALEGGKTLAFLHVRRL